MMGGVSIKLNDDPGSYNVRIFVNRGKFYNFLGDYISVIII